MMNAGTCTNLCCKKVWKFPDFRCTSLQTIINGRAGMHQDAPNLGMSGTFCCGDFNGGLLSESTKHGARLVNTFQNPTLVHGHDPHCVTPYSGNRVVFVA